MNINVYSITFKSYQGLKVLRLNYTLIILLVSRSCESLYKILMDDYIKNDERLSEKSKELNPLEWTKLMNNYKNMAEEIVLNVQW